MQTKPLLYGLIGFFIGGLIVSIAATSINQPVETASDMSMNQMTGSLKDKQGDEFDQAFISSMIEHHEGAVEMAKLADKNAKHQEVKQLSLDIIDAQEKEISQMKEWRKDWGYAESLQYHGMDGMNH